MQRTNIYLDDDQIKALKYLAAEEGKSVAALVRSAVNHYLHTRVQNMSDWREQFEDLVNRVRQRIPETVNSEEIESDITAARQEVKRQHRASCH